MLLASLLFALAGSPGITVDLCRQVLPEQEAAPGLGVNSDVYLQLTRPGSTTVCRWAAPITVRPGPRCKNATAEMYQQGECTHTLLEVSFDCDPEKTRKTSAIEYVKTLRLLGQKEVAVGDAGSWKSSRRAKALTFAHAGCVVLVRRLPQEPAGTASDEQLKELILGMGGKIVAGWEDGGGR